MSLARIPQRRATSRQTLPSRPAPLTSVLRTRIEDAIDALLAVLDAADGDTDLEPDEDLEDDNDQDVSEERHHA